MKSFLRTAAATGVAAATIAAGLSFGPAAYAATSSGPWVGVDSPSVNFQVGQQKRVDLPFRLTSNSQARNLQLEFTAPSGTHFTSTDVLGGFDAPQNITVPHFMKPENCYLSNSARTMTCSAQGTTTGYLGDSHTWYFSPQLQVDAGGSSNRKVELRFSGQYAPVSSSNWSYFNASATAAIGFPFTASSSYDKTDDSFTISGQATGDSTIAVSTDNGANWHLVGDASNYGYSIKLDRSYTPGTSIRVRQGSSGTGRQVTLHTAALTDVTLGKDGVKRTLTAKASANAEIHVSKSDTASDDYQVIKADKDGWIRGVELDQVPSAAKTATIWGGDRGVRTRVNLPLALSANVTNVNVENGTANLQGFVPDGTNLVQIKWGSTTKAIAPAADGTFQYTLDKLAIGSNPVVITALKGGVELGSFNLNVDLKVEFPTAEASFDTQDVERTVGLQGTGTPGAKIEIRRGMKTVGTATIGSDGSWSSTVNAPNMTGTDTLDIVQVVRGQDNGSVELPVDYGVGTTITSPADGFVLEPGSTLVMRGVSQQNSLLRVYEKGKPGAILGSAKADSGDGGWSMAIDDLEDREYDLVVATTSKGYNVTTAEVTINPGKSTVAPLVVTTPASGATVDTKRPVFAGTGDDGATIEIRGSSRVVATTTVANGQWSVPASFDLADGVYALTATQTTAAGATSTAPVRFTIAATAPVTSLTANAQFDAQDVTKPATVTGAATPGATIVLKDSLGNQIGQTTVGSDGKYTITVPSTSAKPGVNSFTVTQRIDGRDVDSKGVSLDYGQSAPIQVTSPINGATVNKDGLTFTGTGQSGAKVVIRGMVNAIASGTVGSDGRWTAPVSFSLTNNVYNLFAVQTTKGGLTTQQPITVTVTDQAVAPLTATARFNPADDSLPAQVVGTAQIGATVIVRDSNGVEVGRTQASSGSYTISVPADRAHTGLNTFTVVQVVDGKESAPLTRTLDYGTPVAPSITSPAQNATIENGSLRFTGTGETGAKLTLRGMVNALGETTIANGAWTIDISRNLTPNVYRLFAVQTGKGGLTKQTEITVTIKDKTVTELTANGAFDSDATKPATISGTAQSGGTVVITENGKTIKTIQVTGGIYSAEIPATVAGVRTFAVTQTVDGITSAPKSVSLDYGTVSPLEVLTPTEGQTVKSGELTFTGKASPGAQVKVSGTSSVLGTANAASDGTFTLPITRSLPPQAYKLFVKQTTKGGLVSDAVARMVTIAQ